MHRGKFEFVDWCDFEPPKHHTYAMFEMCGSSTTGFSSAQLSSPQFSRMRKIPNSFENYFSLYFMLFSMSDCRFLFTRLHISFNQFIFRLFPASLTFSTACISFIVEANAFRSQNVEVGIIEIPRCLHTGLCFIPKMYEMEFSMK